MRVNSSSPRVAEPVLCITKRYKLKIMQVYAPTTSYAEEETTSFYNDVDETIAKPNHYTIVMGDFKVQIGKTTSPTETATGKFEFLELRTERGDTLVEWATSRKYNIVSTTFQKRARRRWAWKSPNGVTKTEIVYTLTNRPDIVQT